MWATEEGVDYRLGMVRAVGVTMVLFSLALAAAVAVYPGHGAAARGYRFCYDFISALGVTRTPGGQDNRLSCWIFNTALGAAMLALLPYWHVRTRHVRGPRLVRTVAFLCCTGFSLGVFGVALSPYDLRPHLHNLCIYSAFALIVPGVLLVLLGSDRALAGGRYRAGWVMFAVALLLCEGALATLVAQHVLPSRPVNPVLQKVNVAVFFTWMATDLWLFSAFLRQRKQALT